MFAKLFNKKDKQVLVKIDTDSNEGYPEVRYFFEPDDMGVCSVAVGFGSDSDGAWDAALKLFNDVDEKKAFDVVAKTVAELDISFSH